MEMMKPISFHTSARTAILATAILLLMSPTLSAGGPCDCASCQHFTIKRQRCYCCVYHGVGGKRSAFDVPALSSSVSTRSPSYSSVLASYLHRSKPLQVGQGHSGEAAAVASVTARGRTTSAGRRAPEGGWQVTSDLLDGPPYQQSPRGNRRDEDTKFRFDRPFFVRELQEVLKGYDDSSEGGEKYENFLTSNDI